MCPGSGWRGGHVLPLASFNLPVWPNMRNVSAPFVLLGVHVEAFPRRGVEFADWSYKILVWRVKSGPNGVFCEGFCACHDWEVLGSQREVGWCASAACCAHAEKLLQQTCSSAVSPAYFWCKTPSTAFGTFCSAQGVCAELCFLEILLQGRRRSHPEWNVVWCLGGGVWL